MRRNSKEKEMITLAHGAGGALMTKLLKNNILKHLDFKLPNYTQIEVSLSELDDSGATEGIAFTTDTYTVKPLFFPGGDIGKLAVAGTVNDLSVMGAQPIALTCGLVIEEGFFMEDLEKILSSMAETAKIADVPIIAGDTKVVERGALDKLIINTAGIGKASPQLLHNIEEIKKYREFNEKWLKDSNIKDGDKIILSGTIGDHGLTVLSSREDYGFDTDIVSDVQPLNHMIISALREGGIVAMKDPTRGGLANALNEWCEKSKIGIVIEEKEIPIREGVKSACELLGIDPLEVGNEGKIILAVIPPKVNDVLHALRKTKEGKEAQIIGEARKGINGVVMCTTVGGKRVVQQPAGDPIPRIC